MLHSGSCNFIVCYIRCTNCIWTYLYMWVTLQKQKLDECSNHTACHPHLSVMHECTVIGGHLHVCFVTDACMYVVWISFKYDWTSFVVFAFCVRLSQISERTKFCNLNISNGRVHSISFMGLLILYAAFMLFGWDC